MSIESQASLVETFQGKPRVFVLTDIGNEPDDQMSLTRFLLYSNDFDTEGLVAVTSTWQREKVSPEIIQKVLSNYGKIRSNLLKHADGFPALEELSKLVKAGQPAYGMAAVGQGQISPGAQLLIEAVDRQDSRPLYVTIWGGANTLAEALWEIREKRSSEEVKAFVSQLRVYAISDQDDAGPWIRGSFLICLISSVLPRRMEGSIVLRPGRELVEINTIAMLQGRTLRRSPISGWTNM